MFTYITRQYVLLYKYNKMNEIEYHPSGKHRVRVFHFSLPLENTLYLMFTYNTRQYARRYKYLVLIYPGT